MKILMVNFNPIFYPETINELVSATRRYSLVHIPEINGYVPKLVEPYLFGMQEDGTYSYYYDYLGKKGKRFNLDTGKLQDTFYWNNGYYKFKTSVTGSIDFASRETLSLIEMPKLMKNKPLHEEIIDGVETIPVLASSVDTLNKLFKEFLTKYQSDKDKTDLLINNMATSIRTAPAVVGSPINPALLGAISNTTPSVVNNLGSKIDAFSDYKDDLEGFIKDLTDIIKEK
jgi:hypothetical protein